MKSVGVGAEGPGHIPSSEDLKSKKSGPKKTHKKEHSEPVGGFSRQPSKEFPSAGMEESPQQQYLASLPPETRTQYNSLIQQNMKLRGELVEIASQMDALASRDSQQPEGLPSVARIELETLSRQLSQQEAFLQSLSQRLKEKKLMLRGADSTQQTEQNNLLVYLSQQLEQLQKERGDSLSVVNAQRRDLSLPPLEETFSPDALEIKKDHQEKTISAEEPEAIKEIQQEIESYKFDIKETRDRIREKEAESKKIHNQLAGVKKIRNKLKECLFLLRGQVKAGGLPSSVVLSNTATYSEFHQTSTPVGCFADRLGPTSPRNARSRRNQRKSHQRQ